MIRRRKRDWIYWVIKAQLRRQKGKEHEGEGENRDVQVSVAFTAAVSSEMTLHKFLSLFGLMAGGWIESEDILK